MLPVDDQIPGWVGVEFEGFHEFVSDRGHALSRIAYLLVGDHASAEDLLQSALARTAAHWSRVVSRGDPEAYVRRVMVNERTSWWRRRRYLEQPGVEVPDLPARDDPTDRAADRLALRQVLAQLAPRQRAVVVLRFYGDLTETEVAAAMGCSVGTVKSQTNAALGRLRQALGSDPPVPAHPPRPAPGRRPATVGPVRRVGEAPGEAR